MTSTRVVDGRVRRLGEPEPEDRQGLSPSNYNQPTSDPDATPPAYGVAPVAHPVYTPGMRPPEIEEAMRRTRQAAPQQSGGQELPPPLLTPPAAPPPPALPSEPMIDMSFEQVDRETASGPLGVPVLALSGHDGSGKTTLARVIAEQYGGQVVSFAAPLKDDLIALGYDRDRILSKPTPPHLRALMRAHGEASRAEMGVDYWVRRWMLSAATARDQGARIVVVDDLRHVSELLSMWHLGGTVIGLLRPEAEPDPADLGVNRVESVREVWAVRSRIQGAIMRRKFEPGNKTPPELLSMAGLRDVPDFPDANEKPGSYLSRIGLDFVVDAMLSPPEARNDA